ncbi:hypothetical protein [Cupriavidus basilensis]|uniref:hypothetical protein n=1 Tax=Cupriavidus basilensis TaxID=68895 RepID=UPI0039F64B14
MITNLIGGNVAAGSSTVGDFAQYHNAGKLRVLAITSAQCSSLLPDANIYRTWPEGSRRGGDAGRMPATSNTCRHRGSVERCGSKGKFASKIRTLGFVAVGGSPTEALARFNALRSFWGPIIRASGFKAD